MGSHETHDCKIEFQNAKLVTVMSLAITILFCTTILEVGIVKQNGYAGVKQSIMTSLPQYIVIKSNTNWAGSIIDSGLDYTTRGSHGDARFDIDCNHGAGPFSVVFDKKDVYG